MHVALVGLNFVLLITFEREEQSKKFFWVTRGVLMQLVVINKKYIYCLFIYWFICVVCLFVVLCCVVCLFVVCF